MIVVCGEALIDLVPAGPEGTWRAVPGGGPANTAVAVARLGTPVHLLCRLSDDAFGRRLRAHLGDNGVDLALAVAAPQATTLAVVGLDEHGSADYSFYVENTADWQWTPGELPAAPPPGTLALHFGSLASMMSPGAEVLRDWAARHRADTTVIYDVNVRPALVTDREAYLRGVESWLDVAHIAKASEDDLRWLHPAADPLDSARSWVDAHGLDLVLVTRGAAGAVAVRRDGPEVATDGFAVPVVDTVGAGDTFTGAFLHARLKVGLPLADALRYAVAAAALTCTREGASPPSAAEVDALVH
jgi:fructokinase